MLGFGLGIGGGALSAADTQWALDTSSTPDVGKTYVWSDVEAWTDSGYYFWD